MLSRFECSVRWIMTHKILIIWRDDDVTEKKRDASVLNSSTVRPVLYCSGSKSTRSNITL